MMGWEGWGGGSVIQGEGRRMDERRGYRLWDREVIIIVGGGGGGECVLNKVLMVRNRHTVLYFLYWVLGYASLTVFGSHN